MTGKFFEYAQGLQENKGLGYRFRAEVLTMIDAPYIWGKETPYGTDCSGTICGPLMDMGYMVRTTADQLMKEFFLDPFDAFDPNKIQALFLVSEEPYETADGVRPAGVARHVCPIVGNRVVVNAKFGKYVILARSQDVIQEYNLKNCYPLLLSLSTEALQELDGKYMCGLDEVFNGV